MTNPPIRKNAQAEAARLAHEMPGMTKREGALLTVLVVFLSVAMLRGVFHAAEMISAKDDAGHMLGLFPLLIDVWAFAAVFGLIAAVANWRDWSNGKRLAFGTTALATMLGYPWSSLLLNLLYPLAMTAVPHGGHMPVWAILLLGGASFLVAPVALLVAGSAFIVLLFAFAASVFTFWVGVPVLLFNQLLDFDNKLHIYRYQARGLAGYIVRFVYWLRGEPLPASRPDDSKGARFAEREEMIARHNADNQNPARMGFGHWIPDGIPFQIYTDKHVLIMASTRSGKGVTLIIPHLLRYPGSAFVLDPKGENARATGRRRAQLNDRVHYLDPFGISGKPQARFNPLKRFTPDNMEAESKALAAAMFLVGERERDHWTAAGQQLLASLILYVHLSSDIPPEKKDLPTVRKVLLGGVKDALKAMTEIDDADGLLRDLAMSFLETPEKEFGSIVSTAQRQTEILDNPALVACLSASGPGEEVDFSLWRRGTMTVYLCLSAPKFPVFNRWLRLVLTSALDDMTDHLDPPKIPVCFMLDELATLGHLQAIENAVGLAAGYGIQLVSVFQDIGQMRDLYKSRWSSFIGNAGVRALFNLDDFDTAQYWSNFIGKRLVETRSTQQDTYGFSKGDNVGEAMRPLLSPDDIMLNFASGNMLVLAQGMHPVVTYRVAYFDAPHLAGQWDDPRGKITPRPQHKAGRTHAPPPQPQQAAADGLVFAEDDREPFTVDLSPVQYPAPGMGPITVNERPTPPQGAWRGATNDAPTIRPAGQKEPTPAQKGIEELLRAARESQRGNGEDRGR